MGVYFVVTRFAAASYPPYNDETCASWLTTYSCPTGFVPPRYPERATCQGKCNQMQCCGRCTMEIYCSGHGSVSAVNGTCVCTCDSGYAGADCSFILHREAATMTALEVPLCARPEYMLEWYSGKWLCTRAAADGLCSRMPLSPGYLRVSLIASASEWDCIAECRHGNNSCRAVTWIGHSPFSANNCVHFSGSVEISSHSALRGVECYLMDIYRPLAAGGRCGAGKQMCTTYQYNRRRRAREPFYYFIRNFPAKHIYTNSCCSTRQAVGSRCCNREQTRCASFCTKPRELYSHTYEEAAYACQRQGLTLCNCDMLKRASYPGGCMGSGCRYRETKF